MGYAGHMVRSTQLASPPASGCRDGSPLHRLAVTGTGTGPLDAPRPVSHREEPHEHTHSVRDGGRAGPASKPGSPAMPLGGAPGMQRRGDTREKDATTVTRTRVLQPERKAGPLSLQSSPSVTPAKPPSASNSKRDVEGTVNGDLLELLQQPLASLHAGQVQQLVESGMLTVEVADVL